MLLMIYFMCVVPMWLALIVDILMILFPCIVLIWLALIIAFLLHQDLVYEFVKSNLCQARPNFKAIDVTNLVVWLWRSQHVCTHGTLSCETCLSQKGRGYHPLRLWLWEYPVFPDSDEDALIAGCVTARPCPYLWYVLYEFTLVVHRLNIDHKLTLW